MEKRYLLKLCQEGKEVSGRRMMEGELKYDIFDIL
jgi:hypothetical protein